MIRLALAAMGTRFELALWGPRESQLRAIGETALEEVRLAHHRLSAFARDSLVARINRASGAGTTPVDADTLRLLQLAALVHQQSGEALDITLGPLMRAWGFRAEAPSAAEAARARSVVGMRLLHIDAVQQRAALLAPGAALDLGAIAKGHALDLAGAVLRAHGVEQAIMHAGTSTVLAMGAPPGRSGWTIALGDRGVLLGPRITLCDQALSVSSPSGRTCWDPEGGREHGHVLDPRTGAPARGAACACAVFPLRAPDGAVDEDACARADAWSTALLVTADRPAGAPEAMMSLVLPAGPAGGARPSRPAPDGDWRIGGPDGGVIEFSAESGQPRRGGALQEIVA